MHAHSERLLRASPWVSRLAASTQSERSIAQAVGSLGLRRRPVWPHSALRGPSPYSGLAQSQGHPGQPALQQKQRGRLQIVAHKLSSRAWGLLGASWGSWGCWGPLSLPLAGPLSALCACWPPEAAARCRTKYILPQPPCTTALGQEGIVAARHATSSQSSQTESALIHLLHAKLSRHVQLAPKRAVG